MYAKVIKQSKYVTK